MGFVEGRPIVGFRRRVRGRNLMAGGGMLHRLRGEWTPLSLSKRGTTRLREAEADT